MLEGIVIAKKKKEDDIALDFSGMFARFKRKSRDKHAAPADDDITIDFRKVAGFAARYGFILLLLAPILFSVYIRSFPSNLPVTEDWARSSIYNQVKQNIRNKVNSDYPNLNAQGKNKLINQRFAQSLQQQAAQIEQAVKANAISIRERFMDDTGQMYLGDIDSYFWARYARNIIQKGSIGDEVRNGVQWDSLTLAPEGKKADQNLYPYIEAYVYKAIAMIKPDANILAAALLTPTILSIVAIIAAFFIGKKIAGNLAGFVAAVIIAVNPSVLSRSLGSDNDIVNVVFPLVTLLFFLLAFDAKDRKKKAVFSLFAGLTMGIYSFAWTGYWHIFYFLIGTLFAYLGYFLLFHLNSLRKDFQTFFRKEMKEELTDILLIAIIFVFFTAVGISLVKGSGELGALSKKPISFTKIDVAARGATVWPNVYTTVAELNNANLIQIINQIGGNLFFLLALMGIMLTLIDIRANKWTNIVLILGSVFWFWFLLSLSKSISIFFFLVLMAIPIAVGIVLSIIRSYKIDIKYAILLITWFAATIYAASKGVRFVLLIVPAFSISFAIFIGKVHEYLSVFLSKTLKINRIFGTLVMLLLIFVLLNQPVRSGYQVARSYAPSVNDGWVTSLQKIRDNSMPDAIINSWWDFGHWFKFFAERRVTFDGGSQNSPQAHWIGKVLLTNDEEQAIGMLRMLDCGGNGAFRIIDSEVKDSLKSISILYEVFGKDREEAGKVFSKYLPAEKVEQALEATYCDPPEDFFITSQDMVGKSGVWAHFGSWNFERAKIHSYYRMLSKTEFLARLKDELGFTEREAQGIYVELLSKRTDRQINDWIAPWPSYAGMGNCRNINNNTHQCDNGIVLNISDKEAYINVGGKLQHPKRVSFPTKEGYEIREYTENVLKFPNNPRSSIGITLLPSGNSYRILLSDADLVGSMFTVLFYQNGIGLKHFDKFHDVRDISGARIITWKIDWDG